MRIDDGFSFTFDGKFLYVNEKRYPTWRTSCRLVYKVGPYVMKFESEEDDGLQTKKEVRMYKKVTEDDKKYFAEVYANGMFYLDEYDEYDSSYNSTYYTWVLQELITPKQRKLTSKDCHILERIINKYEIDDIFVPWNTDPPNHRCTNWLINSKTNLPVIIDGGI